MFKKLFGRDRKEEKAQPVKSCENVPEEAVAKSCEKVREVSAISGEEQTKESQPNAAMVPCYNLDGFSRFFDERVHVKQNGEFHDDLVDQLGGRSFSNGLFKVFARNELEAWEENIVEAFPKQKGLFKLVAYDWTGVCYGVDMEEACDHYGKALIFDVSYFGVMEVPQTLQEFLNNMHHKRNKEILSVELYNEWLEKNPPIGRGECAGFKKPAVFKGKHEV